MGAYAQAVACWLAAARGDRAALAEAQQHLNRAGTLRPNWDHVATLEGDLELFQGRKQAAAAKYRAAIDRGERRLAVWRRAAHVLFDLRQYGEAEALLRRLPEQTRLQGDLGRMSAVLALTDADEAGDPKEKARQALEVARKVVQGGPGDYRDQLWLAQMAWRADQRAEAERAVRKGRELAPNEPVTLVALISVLAQVDRDRARRELADAERTWKGSRDARILMVCHETVGQAKEAEAYARQAVAEQGTQAAALLEVAAFHARNGRADQAEKLWRAVLNLAGAPDDAARAARRSLALDPAVRQTYPTYQEALALIERNLDKAEAVEDRLVKALVLATQPAQRVEAIKLFEALSGPTSSTPDGARLLLAQLYEADGRWPQARAVLRALVKGDNRNGRQLAYAARAFLRHGEPEEVGPLLGRLDAVPGAGFEAVELRARWLHAAGKKAEACALLERHAAAKEDQAGQAALTLASLGEDASAEKILRQLAANPKRPEGLVLLAQYLGLRKRTTEALAVCERAWGTASPQVVATASVAVLRAGSPGDAEKAAVAERIRAALKGQPGSVPLLLALAEVEELRGRSDQVAELYRQVLKAQPGNAVALNNLAYYLAMRHGDPGQGLRLIDQLVKEAGPVGEVLDTRGLILLAAGRAEEAVKDFQAAVKQSPDGVKYFHLAQAHLAAGERDAGKSAWLRAQAAGIKEEALHPLERPAFRSFAGELASN
ncbi:MAG: hypothetical protein U0797_07015 [Gemmataceae bacterium]